VIARVLCVEAETTVNVYKLDDGSGQIDARHAVQSGGSGGVDAKQGTLYVLFFPVTPIKCRNIHSCIFRRGYVQVTGTIQWSHDCRFIDASTVRVLEDPMEAFFHLNKVLAATMTSKGDLVRPSSSPLCMITYPNHPSPLF
jgi:replication factor A2